MNKNDIQMLAIKIALIFTFISGVFLTTYNLFSFKVVKNGYYFIDANQLWLALGVSLIAVSYVIKNRDKI